MKKLSERGQAEWAFAILLVGVVVATIYFLLLSANQRQMQAGANAIGEAVGDAVDNAQQAAVDDGIYMSWKGSQTLVPNKHSVERHGSDAQAAINCYNNNGAFHVMKTSFDGIHLLCNDNDTIRDLVIKQRGNTNEYDLETAFTPKDGTLQRVLQWLRGKPGAGKYVMPADATIYVDGIAP